MSTLSLDVLYRSAGSERKFRPMPTWMDQMNPELRNHEVLGQIVTSLLLDGNAYISTLRDRTGRVVSISVLHPKTVTPTIPISKFPTLPPWKASTRSGFASESS